MAGCGKSGTPPLKPAATQADAPGINPTEQQQMDHFTVFGYAPDGAKRWELTGRGAVVEREIVTIQRPDAIGYDAARMTYLTATLAQVNQNTRRVRMEHDVTIHTSEGLWLSSPLLYWLPDRDEMATEAPVRIETEHMLLRGIGATGHAQLKAAKLLRDIELVMTSSANEPLGEPIAHVTITCDGPLAFDYERNIAVFETNVHVKDREGDLYSDTLVTYLEGAARTIRYAQASGHVRIVNGPHTAHSERAVYEPATRKVTLLGAPSLLLYPGR
jgi:LPS export ABC transporter protein LptC